MYYNGALHCFNFIRFFIAFYCSLCIVWKSTRGRKGFVQLLASVNVTKRGFNSRSTRAVTNNSYLSMHSISRYRCVFYFFIRFGDYHRENCVFSFDICSNFTRALKVNTAVASEIYITENRL